MRNVTSSFLLILSLTTLILHGAESVRGKTEKTWLDDLADYLPWGETGEKKPHILYVVMDDQGYGDIGYTYPDQTDMRTPLLDSLASKGERKEISCNKYYNTVEQFASYGKNEDIFIRHVFLDYFYHPCPHINIY